MTKNEKHEEGNIREPAAQAEAPRIRWDQSKMETTYANVCNVNSTREEVSVLFGTNQTVNTGEQGEILIELNNRIILNPYVAKRFAVVFGKVVENYEETFGPLQL